MRSILTLSIAALLIIFSTTYVHASCKDDSQLVFSGTIVGGIGGAALAGAAISLTATTTGTAIGGAAITAVCAPIILVCVSGAAAGMGVGALTAWLFSEKDCAGAIATDGKQYFIEKDYDSTERALRYSKKHCEFATGRPCEVVAAFRRCGAAAKARSGDLVGFGRGTTRAEARDEALNQCRKASGTSCGLIQNPQCNSN